MGLTSCPGLVRGISLIDVRRSTRVGTYSCPNLTRIREERTKIPLKNLNLSLYRRCHYTSGRVHKFMYVQIDVRKIRHKDVCTYMLFCTVRARNRYCVTQYMLKDGELHVQGRDIWGADDIRLVQSDVRMRTSMLSTHAHVIISDLRYNELATVPEDLVGNPEIRFDVSQNPLECNCALNAAFAHAADGQYFGLKCYDEQSGDDLDIDNLDITDPANGGRRCSGEKNERMIFSPDAFALTGCLGEGHVIRYTCAIVEQGFTQIQKVQTRPDRHILGDQRFAISFPFLQNSSRLSLGAVLIVSPLHLGRVPRLVRASMEPWIAGIRSSRSSPGDSPRTPPKCKQDQINLARPESY